MGARSPRGEYWEQGVQGGNDGSKESKAGNQEKGVEVIMEARWKFRYHPSETLPYPPETTRGDSRDDDG